MNQQFRERLIDQLDELEEQGLLKEERVISSPQGVNIKLNDGRELLNFCANNYLGLANHPRIIEAADRTMIERGYGLASVRFICGTQDIHKQLEQRISNFLGMDDTLLYAAAFDANGGLFEPLLNQEDVIISDSLNHASIIDGSRLSQAKRLPYKHNDMDDLENQLKASKDSRTRFIVTDGVFSMDGTIAQLKQIVALAKKYNAITVVDESHATGFMGVEGRGTHEYWGVMDKIDIITGTLGKALGGGSGGFISGHKEIIDVLRQSSRPYLFSNSLPPAIIGASLKVFDIIEKNTELRDKVHFNAQYFRTKMADAGFEIKSGDHPIVPIMLYDGKLAMLMANQLLLEGINVIGFAYPVVPEGQARIRVQITAAHTLEQIDFAVSAFRKVGQQLGIVN